MAWSIPSIMAAAIGDYVGPKKSAAAIGFVTFIFSGWGRSRAPPSPGALAERTGSFSSSFYMAAAFAGAAIAMSGFLRKPRMR